MTQALRLARALALLAFGALAHACDGASKVSEGQAQGALVVTRGTLDIHVLLTGELQADDSLELKTPRTDAWEVQVRWMAEDGTPVKKGDPIVEFDDTAMLDNIDELSLKVIQAGSELLTQEATTRTETSDKRFALLEQGIAVSKAQIDASIPKGIVSRMERSEYQLVLGRAQLAESAAQEDKKSAVSGGDIEEKVKRIAYDQAERTLEAAEQQIASLTITAPQDGVMIVSEHPWEGRKIQVGDTVFPGMPVAQLPDLSKMVVRAVLSDVDDGRVHPGMTLTCTLDAYADQPIAGTVRSVSPVAREPERGSGRRFFSVVIDLNESDEEMMRPGLSAKLDVESAAHHDVLLAPRSALDRTSQEARARLRSGEEVSVKLGLCNALMCEVVSGLNEGDELGVMPMTPTSTQADSTEPEEAV